MTTDFNQMIRKFLFYPLNYRALCNNYRYNFLFLFTINLNFTTFAIVWKNIRLGKRLISSRFNPPSMKVPKIVRPLVAPRSTAKKFCFMVFCLYI